MLRLSDFHDQIIYRQNASYYSTVFLGLYTLSSPNNYDPNDDDFTENNSLQSDSYSGATGAFLLGNTPYVITDSTVFKINTLTGKTTTLFSYKGSVSCDGSSFYYGNAQYRIMRYDIKVVSIEVCNFTPKTMNYAADEKASRMDSALKYALESD